MPYSSNSRGLGTSRFRAGRVPAPRRGRGPSRYGRAAVSRRRGPNVGHVDRPVSMRFSGAQAMERIYPYKVTLQPQYITDAQDPYTWAMRGAPRPQPTATAGTATPSLLYFTNYGDFGNAWQFTLFDLTNSAALAGLYDNWRLKRVTCEIKCLQNNSPIGQTVMPTAYMLCDRDDSNLPLGQVSLTGRSGVQKYDFGDKSRTSFTLDIKPRLATFIVSGAETSAGGYAQQSDDAWLDCASEATLPPLYYGAKLWINNMSLPGVAAGYSALQLTWTYHLEFKAPLNLF